MRCCAHKRQLLVNSSVPRESRTALLARPWDFLCIAPSASTIAPSATAAAAETRTGEGGRQREALKRCKPKNSDLSLLVCVDAWDIYLCGAGSVSHTSQNDLR